MPSATTFLLHSKTSPVSPEVPSGLLFQCAPDSAALAGASSIPLNELIGDFEVVKQQAANLARSLLCDEPLVRGVQQLSIFEELVIRELQQIIHAKNLHDMLLELGFRKCCIPEDSPLTNFLVSIAESSGKQLQVIAHSSTRLPVKRLASVRRSLRRSYQSGFDLSVVAREFNQALSRIDPYYRRPRRKPKSLPTGGIWFYSTAHTFTTIGLLYEPWFPQQFHYLVENPLTGGAPLRTCNRGFFSPYDYVTEDMAPATQEISQAAQIIRGHLGSVTLEEGERVLVKLYLESPAFSTFIQRLLPKGLFQTTLFQRFVEQSAPACIVVGNPVFEGYLLQAARRKGIPTVLLQHGILGDFCQFIDPPVDRYVVRGKFWRDFLAGPAADRADILSPPQVLGSEKNSDSQRKIVFLTAPYSNMPFSAVSDLRDILSSVLRGCRDSNASLTIRVHPLENVGYYSKLLSSMDVSERVAIDYSHGPGLTELLLQASAAVTFCSTAFLDCLRLRIPIISFDWHHFSFKRQIADAGVFYFAKDLSHLRSLIGQAVLGDLPAFKGATKPFIEPTEEHVLRERLAALSGAN